MEPQSQQAIETFVSSHYRTSLETLICKCSDILRGTLSMHALYQQNVIFLLPIFGLPPKAEKDEFTHFAAKKTLRKNYHAVVMKVRGSW